MPEFTGTWIPAETNPDAFARGYLECAEFTLSEDDSGVHEADGVSVEAVHKAEKVCTDFQTKHAEDLALYYDKTGRDARDAGHDLWYTRNGHGVGFWDRNTTNDPDVQTLLDRLTDAAHKMGEAYAYVGDNGMLILD